MLVYIYWRCFLRIAFLTDNGAGFQEDEIKNLGIHVLPLRYMIDDEEFSEELSDDVFFDRISKSKNLHTSQPSLEDIDNSFDSILKYYDMLVYFTMTGGLSGTYNSALMLSEDEKYKGRVHVIDGRTISILQRFEVLDGIKMISNGKSINEVRKIFENHREQTSIYIMCDTLEYLKKGGRVSPMVAKIGGLLNVKPILYSNGGNFDLVKKVRSMQHGKDMLLSLVKEDIEKKFCEGSYSIGIAYTKCKDEALLFKNKIIEEFPHLTREVPVDPLAKFIACHIGPNAIGIGIYKNIDEY